MSYLMSNERSETIELIKESQLLFEKNNFIFKSATGELSLKKRKDDQDARAKTLFPDVLYFEDVEQFKVSLGWELKFPDTDINDRELFNNAADKANRLNTNAFVLWNFKQAIVYRRSSDNKWEQTYVWDDFDNHISRKNVSKYRELWKKELENIIIHLNSLFIKKEITSVPILVSMEMFLEDISERYSQALSKYYFEHPERSVMIKIKNWYQRELVEFNRSKDKIEDTEVALLFAKTVLVNWINRVSFSNLIKDRHIPVRQALVVLIDQEQNSVDASNAYNIATEKADFYTILHTPDLEKIIPEDIFYGIKEYAAFLFDKNFTEINQEDFQSILETIVEISKRKLMGLYTTPKKLARLLVKSTIDRTDLTVFDPCVGSGTIASSALELISMNRGLQYAHDKVWAADKYSFPLQIANISLSSQASLNMMNIIFQKDLLSLKRNDTIKLTDPRIGELKSLVIPEFDYIVSNLPFIRSERIDEDERVGMVEINKFLESKNLEKISLKSDWYRFGIIALYNLISKSGRIGIIVSNSWLKTRKNKNYFQLMSNLFNIEQVIISGKDKWFKNADVISTILILTVKKSDSIGVTQFLKLNKSLDETSIEEIDELSDAVILNNVDNVSFVSSFKYDASEIDLLVSYGLSLNIAFNDVSWFKGITKVLVKMDKIFTSKRGVKSTNDKFFYDIDDNEIEEEFLVPILKSPTTIDGFYASDDSKAFVVQETDESLLSSNKIGAYNYIKRYENQSKTQSQLKLTYWYQYPSEVYGDFVTPVNPDQRLFWSRVPDNLLINQRLTVFNIKPDVQVGKDLIHALLNSFIGLFMIEATGFGRGLGALDTTKDGVLASYMLNYDSLLDRDRENIISMWELLSQKSVPNILDMLEDEEWIAFNMTIFDAFGISQYMKQVMDTLQSAILLRQVKR